MKKRSSTPLRPIFSCCYRKPVIRTPGKLFRASISPLRFPITEYCSYEWRLFLALPLLRSSDTFKGFVPITLYKPPTTSFPSSAHSLKTRCEIPFRILLPLASTQSPSQKSKAVTSQKSAAFNPKNQLMGYLNSDTANLGDKSRVLRYPKVEMSLLPVPP